MKMFMNALYAEGTGKEISGFYLDQPFLGKISNVRCTYGVDLNVYIDLDEAIDIDGDVRDSLVLSGSQIYNGSCCVARNLNVYL